MPYMDCPTCGGTGELEELHWNHQIECTICEAVECWECDGTGEVEDPEYCDEEDD